MAPPKAFLAAAHGSIDNRDEHTVRTYHGIIYHYKKSHNRVRDHLVGILGFFSNKKNRVSTLVLNKLKCYPVILMAAEVNWKLIGSSLSTKVLSLVGSVLYV